MEAESPEWGRFLRLVTNLDGDMDFRHGSNDPQAAKFNRTRHQRRYGRCKTVAMHGSRSSTRGRALARRCLLTIGISLMVAAGCSSAADEASSGGGRSGVSTNPIGEVTTVNSSVGPLVADGDGFTLYMQSSETTGVPICVEADCVRIWPPVIASNPVATESIDPELLGQFERPEGQQVTYAGQPLYRFAGDALAGQLQGCGTAGTWWPISPDGDPIRTCAN